MEEDWRLQAIAVVRSPFLEKFAVPRQPGLVPAATGEVQMLPPFDESRILDGLEGFSHVWLTFGFHNTRGQGWKPRVRPPRLGGNREVGVFASRAPFRPNHLGMSVVALRAVCPAGRPVLEVGGLDIIDGTPVFDIKPYVPYVDAVPDAVGGFAPTAPECGLPVTFSAAAGARLARHPQGRWLRELVEQTLGLDARPAYRNGAEPSRVYGARLHDVDVRWRVLDDRIEVVEIA